MDVSATTVFFYVPDGIPWSIHISPKNDFQSKKILRAATLIKFFVTETFHSMSLTAKLMVLAHLSTSKRFLSVSPRKVVLFCT